MGALHKWIDLGTELDDLARDQAEWSQATFGTDAERGPVGALRHLAKEAKETEEAVRSLQNNRAASWANETAKAKFIEVREKEVREEFADCLLLLLDASRRARISPLELIRAAAAKMVKNKSRQWSKPTTDEPVEHVRDGEPVVLSPEDMEQLKDIDNRLQRLEVAVRDTVAERNKLREFKRYVHDRLDVAGVPVDPESSHQAEGCRIGGRLDVLIGERDELRRRVAALSAVVGA